MRKISRGILILVSLAFVLPAFGWTYKFAYPNPCSEVWPAVKDTLGDEEHYGVLTNDEAKMTASYNVKHAAHTNVSGAILQRTNKVTLVPKGNGCEMQVVSNYSGWEHDDKSDFKKRVDESLAKLKVPPPPPPAKPDKPASGF